MSAFTGKQGSLHRPPLRSQLTCLVFALLDDEECFAGYEQYPMTSETILEGLKYFPSEEFE